jgi:tetratricopeptide (TPR) repeat protein
VQTKQGARALTLLQPLLAEPGYAENASLWWLANTFAGERDNGWAAVPYLEKALDLDYQQLPDVVDLQKLRQDYGTLLGRYQTLAVATRALGVVQPSDFLARVLRAADRWRSLDPDGTAACQAAARVLKALGETDLAWDYLTTPIGQQPNQAAPWLKMADALREEGSLTLAERAYAQAFEAEPTNAQILWDRALLLQQTGRSQEAQKLYRQLAEGQWQPRFQWLQNQARQQLQGK